jgi:hypothetical protein
MQTLPEKPTALADMLSISIPYASQLLGNKRPWTLPLAIAVFRKTGTKLGPIVDATEDEIAVLARFEKAA